MKEIYFWHDAGREWGSMHIFTGRKWVDKYLDVYVNVDKMIVSFGDRREVTFPKIGDDVRVWDTSYNLTLSEIYQKVLTMMFDGKFSYYRERKFEVYDI